MSYISVADFCFRHDVSVAAMCHHIVSKQYAVVHHADMTIREFRRTFFCLPGSEQYARFPEKICDLCLTQAGCERLRSDIAMGLS